MAHICLEHTADGPQYFSVDSKETFDALMELNDKGTDEAGAWGGFEFDIDGTGGTITMDLVNDAKEMYGINKDDFDPDGDDAEQAYEDAYLHARD